MSGELLPERSVRSEPPFFYGMFAHETDCIDPRPIYAQGVRKLRPGYRIREAERNVPVKNKWVANDTIEKVGVRRGDLEVQKKAHAVRAKDEHSRSAALARCFVGQNYQLLHLRNDRTKSLLRR